MKPIEIACYGLLASAFVLAGLLVVQLQQRTLLPEAEAELVLTRGPITALTVRAREDDEALFILHNTAQRLLIYRTDLGRRQLQLKQNINVGAMFGTGPGVGVTPGAGGSSGGRAPR